MSNKEYEYKFDTVKPPEDRVYDDRVMHYYENHSNEPARPLILALGKHITDRVLYKLPWLPKVGKELTVNDPEYWGLASIVTDEMAEVALKMKVHKGMKLKEIIKATGKSAAYLEPLLKEMANVGLVEFNWENPEHEKQYMLPMFVPGSAEFFNMKWDNICEHPQVANFFERMTQLPLEAITPMVPPGGAGIGMHVIPVEKAISMENQSADVEHISHWLDKYDGKYAAGPCSCRYSRAMCGEGCADDPEDWCIGVGDMADYLVETNKGHYITREMVMEILQRAEDNGFVHQITNIDGENKIFAICNCQVKVCNALRTSQLFNTPNMSRSAYVAKVEAKDCVACGKCVEFCPAGAVKLGQKLCKKEALLLHILSKNFQTQLNGARKNGRRIIEIKTELIATIQVRRLAKLPAPLISQFKAILKWRHRADIPMLWLLLKRITLSLQFAAEFVIRDARRLAQEQLLMKQLLLMTLSALSLKRTLTVKQDIFLKK